MGAVELPFPEEGIDESRDEHDHGHKCREHVDAVSREVQECGPAQERSAPQSEDPDIEHELHRPPASVAVEERYDGSEENHYQGCDALGAVVHRVERRRLLGVLRRILQSALHVPDDATRGECRPADPVDLHLCGLVDALAVPPGEQRRCMAEEIGRLRVFQCHHLADLPVPDVDLEGHRSAESADVLSQTRGVDDDGTVGERAHSVGGGSFHGRVGSIEIVSPHLSVAVVCRHGHHGEGGEDDEYLLELLHCRSFLLLSYI